MPCQVAGSDLGPASDLRGGGSDPSRRRDEVDEELRAEEIDRDRVVLTTFHRAKGLQWLTVLIVGLSEGLMPLASARTPDAVAEECRLLYVALTRSEEDLWCSWSESDGSVSSSGTLRTRQPSPWLAPIERTIRQLRKEASPTTRLRGLGG